MSYILDRSRIGIAAALGVATLFALAPIAQAAPRARVQTSYVQDYVATVDGEASNASPDSVTLSCEGTDLVTDVYHSIQAVDGGAYADVKFKTTPSPGGATAKTWQYYYEDSSTTSEERENSRAQIRFSLSCVPAADSLGAPITFNPAAPGSGNNWGFPTTISSGGYDRKLMVRRASTTSVDLSTLGAGEVTEVQVTCPDPPLSLYDYNAIMDNGSTTNTPSLRIVGVEPAGNDMTFRVINEYTAAIPAAALAPNVVCLRQSTTKGKKP